MSERVLGALALLGGGLLGAVAVYGILALGEPWAQFGGAILGAVVVAALIEKSRS